MSPQIGFVPYHPILRLRFVQGKSQIVSLEQDVKYVQSFQ